MKSPSDEGLSYLEQKTFLKDADEYVRLCAERETLRVS
jgi:hypothetical protein